MYLLKLMAKRYTHSHAKLENCSALSANGWNSVASGDRPVLTLCCLPCCKCTVTNNFSASNQAFLGKALTARFKQGLIGCPVTPTVM